MTDFPSNSKMARDAQPREKIQAVTSARAEGRKRGLGRQFKETFFEGTGRGAVGLMVDEVVIPTIRDMFADALRSGVDHLFYGDSHRTRRGGVFSTPSTFSAGQVDYNGISKPAKASQPRTLSRADRARHNFSDIIIPTQQEALEVLDRMYDILNSVGEVNLAELYELVNIRPEHTDVRWGWTSLRGAKPRSMGRNRGGGFLLDLPEPQQLR